VRPHGAAVDNTAARAFFHPGVCYIGGCPSTSATEARSGLRCGSIAFGRGARDGARGDSRSSSIARVPCSPARSAAGGAGDVTFLKLPLDARRRESFAVSLLHLNQAEGPAFSSTTTRA